MYVFRDGRRQFAGPELLDCVRAALGDGATGEDALLRALISAGELECALRDAADEEPRWLESAQQAERVTEAVANAFVGSAANLDEAQRIASFIEVPARLSVAVMEGFAYYALHPRKFLHLIERERVERDAAVIGIRSIGAPLSATVAAALGDASRRITVRPTGHPYDRKLEASPRFREFVARHQDKAFVIVDEGPGLSGSSFLAVAEALVECGVPQERVQMLCSREVPDPAQLRTPNAAARWKRFRCAVTEQVPILPAEAHSSIGGGWWRRTFLQDAIDQPASWTQLEMAKYVSADGRTFFRFEGFGHFGEEIGSRAQIMERTGFGVPYLGNRCGFGMYEVVQGKSMHAGETSEAMLARLAEYCAMRKSEFGAQARDESKLAEMLRWNWQCEFGEELPPVELPVEHLVVADARMMPHEWLETADGPKKLDAVTHGDDHFFPGPCDIAWDVAGAIVEWEMDDEARAKFVGEYERRSGDRVSQRLPAYLLAYATFRMAWSKMAASASAGEFDEELLSRDHARYRKIAQGLAPRLAAANMK